MRSTTQTPIKKRTTMFEKLTHILQREPQDREELIEVLHDAKERHLLDNDALEMIEGVLDVTEMKVRDVMVPRPQMVVVEQMARLAQALPTVIEASHSRFPVVGDNRDEIVGILLAKDLLPYNTAEQQQALHVRDLIRPATFIPESKRLDVLLKEFRLNRNHMAIVVDEYGGVSGLVTIEDVLEEIVGEIEDEYDVEKEEPFIVPLNETEYVVRALIPIEEFNRFFETDYADEDFDTLGGLLLQKLSHLPKRGESVQLDQFKVVVVEASNRGIVRVRLTRLPPTTWNNTC